MKTVAAVAGASAEFSQGVLVGEVDPQTRWSLGSIVASLLAMSANPLLVCLRDTAQGVQQLLAVQSPVAGVDLEAFAAPDLVLERGPGTSKSRPVSVVVPAQTSYNGTDISVANAAYVEGANPLHDVCASLISPGFASPSFTLLGILNKLESYLDSLDPGWALLIDQTTEKIVLLKDRGNEEAAITAIDGAAAIAKFDLTLDPTTETVPGYGWE